MENDCINKKCGMGMYDESSTFNCGFMLMNPEKCKIYLKANKEPVANVLLQRGVMRDLAGAEKDYNDDMERVGKQTTNKISEREREQFINNSFTDSQGCY